MRKSHKQDKEKADKIPSGTDYQGMFTGFDRRHGKSSIAYRILLAKAMAQAVTAIKSVHYGISVDAEIPWAECKN